MSTVIVEFDGGCYNNPNGQAASGAVVRSVDGEVLRHVGRAIGIGSNNVAEWTGLKLGLEAARELGATEVRVFGDSQLVVRQFKGEYAVKVETLRLIAVQVSAIATSFRDGVTIEWMPRERNVTADAICTAVLRGVYNEDEPDVNVATGAARSDDTGLSGVEVTFVVTARMDPKLVRLAFGTGVSIAALREKFANEAERRIVMASVPNDIALTPKRVRR